MDPVESRQIMRAGWRRLAWAASLGTAAATAPALAAELPRCNHVVVVEENKDFDQIIDNPAAPISINWRPRARS
jgi:hypothetical protein